MYRETVALERWGFEVCVLPREGKKQRPRPYPVKAVGRMLRNKKDQTDYDRGRMPHGGVFALTVGDQDRSCLCNLTE